MHKVGPLNSIHIEVARNVCNIRCKFCYIDFAPSTPRYDYSGLDKVVDYCRSHHVPYITIQGGEITAIPQGYKFCAALAELGVSISVMTNGVKINDGWARIFATSCHRVNVSINTPDPATYHEIIGPSWETVYRNIERIDELRKTSPKKMDLSISMVIVKQTFHQIVDFYRLSKKLPVDFIVLFPDISSEQKVDLSDPANQALGWKMYEELRDLMAAEPKLHYENQVALDILRDFVGYQEKPAPEAGLAKAEVLKTEAVAAPAQAPAPVPTPDAPVKPKRYCTMPSSMVYIDHNLDVFTCCGTTGIKYGNLKDADLDTIISNPKRQGLQDKIAGYDYSDCSKFCTLMPR